MLHHVAADHGVVHLVPLRERRVVEIVQLQDERRPERQRQRERRQQLTPQGGRGGGAQRAVRRRRADHCRYTVISGRASLSLSALSWLIRDLLSHTRSSPWSFASSA